MLDELFLVRNGIMLPDEQDREVLLTLLEQDRTRLLESRRTMGLEASPEEVERELAAQLRRHRERVLWVFRPRDLDASVEDLDLSIRAYNTLRRNSIRTVGEILDRPRAEIRALRNMGEKGFRIVLQRLADYAVRQIQGEWRREDAADGTGFG
ncbi:MAG: hypothetical protein II458_00550 [Oscillospiraceae bacterium]|nr:hypothetical protein [Oscillospiraceae bacterium]